MIHMKTQSGKLVILVLTLVGASLNGTAIATPFPFHEEIQSLAYKRDTDYGPGVAGFRSMEAGLIVSDFNPGLDLYYLAAAGMSNFAGKTTVEAGIIKTCPSSKPSWCGLHPYGLISDTTRYQRTILSNVQIGGGSTYTYRAERVATTPPNNVFQMLWCSAGCQKLLDGTLAVTALPFAYTRGASVGPRWGFAKVKAAKFYPDGASRTTGCYSATDNTNEIAALSGTGSPFVTMCNPKVGDWSHVFSYNAYTPVLSSAVTR